MKQYVGLDVSLEQTAVCIVDEQGKALWRGKCAATPEAIAAVVKARAPHVERIGLESGPLLTWCWHELKKRGLPVICLDERHAKAALSLVQPRGAAGMRLSLTRSAAWRSDVPCRDEAAAIAWAPLRPET